MLFGLWTVRGEARLFYVYDYVYHCMNVTPNARQMRFSGSWYYAHVGTLLNCPLRHLAQILPILADFSTFTDWFRISTWRIRGGNVRFINASSNGRLRDRTFILCVSPYFPIFFPFRFSQNLRSKPFGPPLMWFMWCLCLPSINKYPTVSTSSIR